ncbi:HalX domain-containing protein, partial [Halobacterium sp. CBA1126]|uniref:HalX domain-containing protein n=1 Tax=Halobacterium sp. CBA1126 TaxID=2668074 RepID=UPI0012FB009B
RALEEADEDVASSSSTRHMPDRSGDDVLAAIHDHDYDCQVAMVTAVDPDFDTLELGFDAYVVKPVERDELEALVKQLLVRSLYNEEVQEYFALASKRATIETTKTDAELAADERYQQLCEDIRELREKLDQRVTDLDDEDFLAVFHDLQARDGATSD